MRDRPSDAGLPDFETGEARDVGGDVSAFGVIKRVLTHPVLLTIAFIEFCTGVLRNGVMSWYPIYVNEVEALPQKHYLNTGDWGSWYTIWPFFGLAALSFALSARAKGAARTGLRIGGGLLFMAPFLQAGWGGMQMVAGIVGGTLAGFVSDLFFQSRRAPAAAGLYALMIACTAAMFMTLGQAMPRLRETNVPGLEPGDRITSVAGQGDLRDWVAVRRAFTCVPAPCLPGRALGRRDLYVLDQTHARGRCAVDDGHDRGRRRTQRPGRRSCASPTRPSRPTPTAAWRRGFAPATGANSMRPPS